MTKRNIIRVVVVLILLIDSLNIYGAVFKITKKNYDKIDIGMTKEKVIEIIGRKPDEVGETTTKSFGTFEYWTYKSAGTKLGLKIKIIYITFVNGKVYSKDWIG